MSAPPYPSPDPTSSGYLETTLATGSTASAWDQATLCVDADISRWESSMPAMARACVRPGGGSAYDNKRALAKETIGIMLEKRGARLEGILTPQQLTRAATLLELALLYQDIAVRPGTIAATKADFYMGLYEQEMDGITFDYQEPAVTDVGRTKSFGHIEINRA